MISVDEELGLSASLSVGDGRCVELVVDATLALRLGIQRVTAPVFDEDF